MKKYIYIFLVAVVSIVACDKEEEKAQHLVTFEEYELEAENHWYGQDSTGDFTNNNAVFNNYFGYSYGFPTWAGFGYSNRTSDTTSGMAGEFIAFAGSGARLTSNYGVAYQNDFLSINPGIVFIDSIKGVEPVSIRVTNNSWAALSMRDGDGVAKKFGGDDGNDADWFKLTIEGIGIDNKSTGTVEFYLADYRNTDNSKDYIVKDWTEVNLLTLGVVKSLKFSLSSSDVGQFGMNTPAYFCIDDLYFLTDN